MCDKIVERFADSKSVYAYQETAAHSIEGRCMKLLTISSYRGITKEREEVIPGLFPEGAARPFK